MPWINEGTCMPLPGRAQGFCHDEWNSVGVVGYETKLRPAEYVTVESGDGAASRCVTALTLC